MPARVRSFHGARPFPPLQIYPADTPSLQTGIMPIQERKYETFKERDARRKQELQELNDKKLAESRRLALEELVIATNPVNKTQTPTEVLTIEP